MSFALKITRGLHQVNEELHQKVRLSLMRRKVADVLRGYSAPYSLHLGCGGVYLKDWINIDLGSPTADVHWDLTAPLPIADASCQYIFHEHMLEHFPVEIGLRVLRDCHRVLRPGGVLRVAMPSLRYLTDKYSSPDWRSQEWLKRAEYQSVASSAEMLNIAFRWWGHAWLYDEQELTRRLKEAGFGEVRSVNRGESSIAELRNRESRPDSLLIMEAVA